MDFFDEPCTVEIKRGVAVVAWPSGTRMAFPLDVFREQVARATDALNVYDHGNVVDFPRPKRGRKPKGEAG